ncbi:MtrAB system histidine kinase MtrB [Schaalia sp. lx-260]|uniref:MtrAB system histidine kinase MtrB n=1 Tax=Schaalia sp. lx-260 TaxID=2899082 RepID=UPI001E54E21F|nr:MtrAB system histidine kinase MtrB [Schaalia sp. lx-260]MCD4549725.1 ATP-binding protein [Schaalia sp. lx-260]
MLHSRMSVRAICDRLLLVWTSVVKWRWFHAIRSSLSLRAAVTLTVAGVLAIVLFGAAVSTQMRTNVFEARRTQVLEDASVRFSVAQGFFDQSTASNSDQVQETARQVVESIRSSAAGAGAVSVLLLRSEHDGQGIRINEIADPAMEPVISSEFRTAVIESSHAQWQSVDIGPALGNASDSLPAILVGKTVNLPRAGTHGLYIVYSLGHDQAMIDTVMNVLILASTPLLIAVPIGAFWMLHHLMRPVRRTASAATELAGGNLTVRVPESGSDEMSDLAHAFNNMAASLQEKINEYDMLSKFQQRFVSDVSHELRTPLTTIRMAEEMIYDDRESLGPAAKRSVELLHGQVERFESMLADLLEISRYDAQAALLDLEICDMRLLVEKVVAAHEELAQKLDVRVRVHLPHEQCAAEADARRIERVLRNLLVNALEHAEKTDVVIDVACDNEAVAVRVRDYGIGMTPETAQRVFDRFYRADPARTRTTGGTGLGLSIAREDVALHGGILQAYGQPGQGASFVMTLPVSAGKPVRTHPLVLWEEEQAS